MGEDLRMWKWTKELRRIETEKYVIIVYALYQNNTHCTFVA